MTPAETGQVEEPLDRKEFHCPEPPSSFDCDLAPIPTGAGGDPIPRAAEKTAAAASADGLGAVSGGCSFAVAGPVGGMPSSPGDGSDGMPPTVPSLVPPGSGRRTPELGVSFLRLCGITTGPGTGRIWP